MGALQNLLAAMQGNSGGLTGGNAPDTPTDMSQQQPGQQPPQSQPQQPDSNASGGPVKQGLRGVLLRIMHNVAGGGLPGAAYPGDLEGEAYDRHKAAINSANAETALKNAQVQQMQNTIPFQMPNGAVLHLPSKMATELAKQQLANQGKVDAAGTSKRFITTPAGLYDTQTKDTNGFPSLIPNSGAGVTITPEMTTQYPIPKEFVGKQMKLTDLAALERGQAFSNAMIQTSAGPVVVPKVGPNMGKATPVTINGKPIASNQEAGAYWQAKYGVVQTVDADGNPQYESRLSAPGSAPATGALQIMKGKAGLENYKDALVRVKGGIDAGVLDDPGQRALIARTMRTIGTVHDPGIISATIGNMVSSGLSPQAADLTAAMLQAREFIGANRQFAGNFNGSEALYQRMVSNAPGVANSKQLNQSLINQDMNNTVKIEAAMKRFQGGAKPTAPTQKKGDPLGIF